MSLDVNIISGIDFISNQSKVDFIGPNSPIPLEIIFIIFQNLKADLPNIALVCTNWKVIADDKNFRNLIRPTHAFGSQEWKEYIEVDAGEEPCLPRRAYGDLNKFGSLLTFIPKQVYVTKEDGKVEEIILDNLEAIGNLIKKPKSHLETGFSSNCLEIDLKEKRKQEKSHWVWIRKQIIGHGRIDYHQEKDAKALGANVSGLIDTVISVFMQFIRLKEGNFTWNPEEKESIKIRVKDKSLDKQRICLSFTPSGLYIARWGLELQYRFHGVALAQKSY